MSRLDGRTAILVGAGAITSGWSNGRACAVTYAERGAIVVCVDHVLKRAEETAQLVCEAGGKAIAMRADATIEQDLRNVVEAALAETGRLDVMHNNVGVGGSVGTPDQVTLEDFQREVAQNLTTAYLGIRLAAPVMQERGGGVILNTSSLLAVRFLSRPTVAYGAAKAGVEALTRSCAAAYGRDNIRVNCLRIGFSETPLALAYLGTRNLSGEERERALDTTRNKVPLRREHGSAFDVARAAAFLASDDARHLSGVILNIDGASECAPI
jgi:NAD(P)-dependent dehydrogenase (short-subunit alcohol dehydrogenase family)